MQAPRVDSVKPDVSIVIPTMRRPAALMRAARSALAQMIWRRDG